ncbi:hypothetical protein DSM03_105101 [Leeuwenhoekiella aestuarii]|uniref:Outer membrane protein assembly factor BamA n=1 Tax=Leeuwenhoekiella aestuarii TaxID=2249426 RepID=A0A4Q0NR16_9FLAO|nr:hypothetical protein [Leeuwenhoekiella aestuarii]RXG12620.1 hypothetical protein DSM04_106101 [Leeuwenhoekiella aestuarii]RXG14567.1 hypothetical protein DSM03_105101 [Leeuwenhoekiella aestuarii]
MKQKQFSRNLLLATYLLSLCSAFSQNISLEIITNSKSEDSLISKYFQNIEFASFIEMTEEINQTKNKLYLEGYLQHKFYNLKKKSKENYSVEFLSKKKTNQITLYIYDIKTLDYLSDLDYTISKNSIEINPQEIREILPRLTQNAAETGNPLTTFQVINILASKKGISAELKVNRKDNRNLTKVVIKGYTKFPQSFIKHQAKLKTPVLFQKKKILDKTKTLEELDFILFSKAPELQFKKDSTSLYLYIDKKNANTLEGFLGFSSNEDESILRLAGYLNLNLLNNFNQGERINLTYKSNGENQQILNLNTNLPFLFKSPISLSAGINIFRQDSTFSNASQTLETSLSITKNTFISTSLELEQSTTSQNTENTYTEPYKKQIYSGKLSYSKKRNSPLQPQSAYLEFITGTAFRKTQARNTTNQIIASLNAAYNFKLNSSHSLYLNNQTAILKSTNYLDNELFRFGGINNIRGFKENSLSANLYTTLQTEYRYSPNQKIYVNTIIDAAYYENNLNNQEAILYSFGLGTSLLTKAGILKLNLATGIHNNQKFELSNSILHLTLIANF